VSSSAVASKNKLPNRLSRAWYTQSAATATAVARGAVSSSRLKYFGPPHAFRWAKSRRCSPR
jgi:hypothetical protein